LERVGLALQELIVLRREVGLLRPLLDLTGLHLRASAREARLLTLHAERADRLPAAAMRAAVF
jgi:hypothetical protein